MEPEVTCFHVQLSLGAETLLAGRVFDPGWKARGPSVLSPSSRCCLTRCHFRGTRKWGHQPAVNYVQPREADEQPLVAEHNISF